MPKDADAAGLAKYFRNILATGPFTDGQLALARHQPTLGASKGVRVTPVQR